MMTVQQAFDLALQHHQAGRLAEAEALYRQILAVQPNHAETLHLLGVTAHQTGRHELAVQLIRQTIALNPSHVAAHSNLGETYRCLRCFDEATASLNRALQLNRNHAPAYLNLGNVLCDQRRLEEAIEAYRRAIDLNPDMMMAYYNLGNALKDRGLLDEAIAVYRYYLQVMPGDHEGHNNLGAVLASRGHPDEAIVAYRRALELKPDYSVAHNNLGSVLRDQGDINEAVTCFQHAVELKPEQAWVHSNLIYTLHFHPAFDPGMIGQEQERWNRQFGEPLGRWIIPHVNDRDPERRLRIGYVSPDFRHHVICHFLTPLLEAHDHTQFAIHCYSSVRRPDAITERLKKTADLWRDVRGVSDEALAETIRADGIDILVDLTQHMAENQLLVFARKPAPVQVAWLGYPASTGLEAMDYRFTDAFMEPMDSKWSASVERPVRLPDAWFCFDPIDEYPEPGPLPALTAGQVTFGSLNNFCKINEAVLRLWAQVLQSVDGSRLLMQCPAGTTQARVRQWFEAQGIAAHRLELVSRTATREEFLQLFERIDLALETFPYNGGTTTCEALWMGVPVPTFPGSTAVSRIGLSILSAAGLPELIAAGQEEYVRLAVSLATDLPRLGELRATLRQRMKTSVFMDAPRFARDIERAYRAMWRQWCEKETAK